MRQARLKAPDDYEVAYYHTISRVVNREFVLGEEEREQFVETMRCYCKLPHQVDCSKVEGTGPLGATQ